MTGGAGPRVAVVGAGIVGISCALHLQRLGASVTVIDRNEPGHADAASDAPAAGQPDAAAGPTRSGIRRDAPSGRPASR